jgi:hypothetical protein
MYHLYRLFSVEIDDKTLIYYNGEGRERKRAGPIVVVLPRNWYGEAGNKSQRNLFHIADKKGPLVECTQTGRQAAGLVPSRSNSLSRSRLFSSFFRCVTSVVDAIWGVEIERWSWTWRSKDLEEEKRLSPAWNRILLPDNKFKLWR